MLLAATSLSVGLMLAPTGGFPQLLPHLNSREFLASIERDRAEAHALGAILQAAHVRVFDWLAAQRDGRLAGDLVAHLRAGSGLPAAGSAFSPFTADERDRFADAGIDIRICGGRLVGQFIPRDGFVGRLSAPYVRSRNRMGMVTGAGVQPWGNPLITDPELTGCGLTEGAPVLMGRWRAPAIERLENLRTQSRAIGCPDGEVGSGIHQTREVRHFRDGFGAPVPADTVEGAWTETFRDCRTPRTGTVNMAVECTITTGHRAGEPGTKVLSFPWREGRDPQDPREVRKVVDWASPTVAMDLCRGISEEVDTTTVHDTVARDAACTVVHAPEWTRGGPVRQVRDRYTTNVVFPASWGRPDEQVVALDPWRTLADDCHRRVLRTRSGETRTGPCPAGRSGAGQFLSWVEVWTHVEYADPVPHRADHALPGSLSRRVTGSISRCTAPARPDRDPDEDRPYWQDNQGNVYSERPRDAGPEDGHHCHCGGTPQDPRNYPPNDNDNRDDGNGGGGGGGGCFLTTAVAGMRGESDDGPTLSLLRDFRDGWLSARPGGRQLVAEYYHLAPSIVAAVPQGHPEWNRIADEVDRAASDIRSNDPELAFAVYCAMVRRLEAEWLS